MSQTAPTVSDSAPVFVDTAYVMALLNTRDQWHAAAIAWERRMRRERRRLITTEFVLVEIADGLASVRFRRQAARAIAALQDSPFVEVIPASTALLRAALRLFEQRPDKDWGLTDCSSFVAMQERSLVQALTTDVHFEQAGFLALLRGAERA